MTATQKTILKAFKMDAGTVRKDAKELENMLVKYEEKDTGEE